MAIEIKEFKPFYAKLENGVLRIVLAANYLSIIKDDETFQFIPIEGKEILVDILSGSVTNLSDVFVFQRGNRFIRMPIYQLQLVSNFKDFLLKIIASGTGKYHSHSKGVEPMKQIIKIIRKVDIEREYRHMLTLEQDYELASLSQALKDGNNAEIIRSKKRLKEIHNELEDLTSYC